MTAIIDLSEHKYCKKCKRENKHCICKEKEQYAKQEKIKLLDKMIFLFSGDNESVKIINKELKNLKDE